ncbi:DnaA regulatory inactivator HdaA [Pseudomonas sp. R2.Fl]|nr:DnaA regulatory inactivator HdaA [Pseudomonas sp. R2.Fl]
MSELKKVASRRPRAEQLPLALAYPSSTGRDDLLVSERMEAAVALIDSWPAWPSPVVIITGPAGSGKSHLAAIWRETSGAVDIDAREGSNSSLTAATSPVLLEDADRADYSETELFHVINSVRQNGTALLMTARTWPLAWPVSLADLRSRLRAATMIEIGEADEEHLTQLVVKLFADRQLHVDDKIVGYIIPRIERSFSAAQEVVERIDRLALSRRAKVSRTLAAEVIEEILAQSSQEDRLSQ